MNRDDPGHCGSVRFDPTRNHGEEREGVAVNGFTGSIGRRRACRVVNHAGHDPVVFRVTS